MAIQSCESTDVNHAMAKSHELYERYRRKTKCLDCPNNQHHDYPIMGGYITASFCKQDGEWLDPREYRSTIYEMGCEV